MPGCCRVQSRVFRSPVMIIVYIEYMFYVNLTVLIQETHFLYHKVLVYSSYHQTVLITSLYKSHSTYTEFTQATQYSYTVYKSHTVLIQSLYINKEFLQVTHIKT